MKDTMSGFRTGTMFHIVPVKNIYKVNKTIFRGVNKRHVLRRQFAPRFLFTEFVGSFQRGLCK